jgi:hypothetical protein
VWLDVEISSSEVYENNQINFLDITIHRTPTTWKTGIYRKPTFTDTISPYTSDHPTQHKYATIRFLYNRPNTYDLQEDDYNTIQYILHNSTFPIHHPIRNPPPDTTKKQTMTKHTNPITKMGYIHVRRKRNHVHH